LFAGGLLSADVLLFADGFLLAAGATFSGFENNSAKNRLLFPR